MVGPASVFCFFILTIVSVSSHPWLYSPCDIGKKVCHPSTGCTMANSSGGIQPSVEACDAACVAPNCDVFQYDLTTHLCNLFTTSARYSELPFQLDPNFVSGWVDCTSRTLALPEPVSLPEFGEWHSWESQCTDVCGAGTGMRTRECRLPFPNSDSNCTQLEEAEPCQPCSICNATLVEEAGSIKSPNYPEEYDNNLDCTLWLNTNGIVTIDVKDFRLEEDSECDSDYLKVITESGSKKYCDTVIPPKFSNASNVKLEFFSDFSGTFRGFQLDYYISDFACGGTIAGNRPGLIASPGYPGHYPQDAECNWLIETGAPMALTFRRVELDASCEQLMVKHDGEWSQNLALNQISRGNNELTILTEGGNIDVKLVTCQARDSGAGFLMNFKED